MYAHCNMEVVRNKAFRKNQSRDLQSPLANLSEAVELYCTY